MTDWGRICVGTRLEKQVDADFVTVWSYLISKGLRRGDSFLIAKKYVAHVAANVLVRNFLRTEADTLLMLDSDADIGPNFLSEFRDYEPGWEYDILQAWYPRRGWPPEAIWFKQTSYGDFFQRAIFGEDLTEAVPVIGTHAVLIRRSVFEGLLGKDDPASHDWFFYPRGQKSSEDGAFSREAVAAGFRLGATTHVKAGHIQTLTVDWSTYQEYMQLSGSANLNRQYNELLALVANFTGEKVDTVQAKVLRGRQNVNENWKHCVSGAEARAQYGAGDNGYLYDLIRWNFAPLYKSIVDPLKGIDGKRVLVVGPGIGGEIERLVGRSNQVDVYELPGTLRRFCQGRFDSTVNWLPGNSLLESNLNEYDLVVMVDVVEHIHPDEFNQTMDCLADTIGPGGAFYIHAPFWQDKYPNEYDHSLAFRAWTERWGLKPEGDYLWRK